ncbi:hypothetical protein AK830_g11743 [Neonectria ditissima]|uniref:3'-5' exonuclease domain-containing protein n=1 Tax=Neonectria ditissima TaxID=78410 RepID=A0A0P7B1Z8_9HYPO|nr:hypothetical protein AK830_g11743 [Neonectria ditissima]
MSSPARNQLWNPKSGIRFSPGNDTNPSYPGPDMPRFVHGTNLNPSSDSQPMKLDLEQFDDDEQFELDATEWFDQYDASIASIPPVQGIECSQGFEGFDTFTDSTSNSPLKPKDASKPKDDLKPKDDVQLKDGSKPKEDYEAMKPVFPPVTSLEYKISNELFQAALKKKEGTSESYWSHTMYQHIKNDEKVKVHYCTTKNTMEWVCKKYFLDEKVLGFDLEWMAYAKGSSGPREQVSLIQIASPGHIGLFHVAVFAKDDFIAPTFRKIMEDESVSKAGVNIRGDCTRLRKYLDVETKGIFELSHLYKLVKYSKEGRLNLVNKTVVSMAVQVKNCLGLSLFKGDVRTSNWMRVLNGPQIAYSASDAYAGIQLFYALEHEREKLDPCPPRPEFAEKSVPIKVAVVVDEVADADEDMEIDLSMNENETEDPAEPVAQAAKNEKAFAIPKPKKTIKQMDSRIAAADVELKLYRSQKQNKLAASPSAVRTYYIWHANVDLSPESIAKLLRDPPLKTNTVVEYILKAITLEKMPFSKERLRNEVLSFLATSKYVNGKYKALIQQSKETEQA